MHRNDAVNRIALAHLVRRADARPPADRIGDFVLVENTSGEEVFAAAGFGALRIADGYARQLLAAFVIGIPLLGGRHDFDAGIKHGRHDKGVRATERAASPP